MKAIVVTPGKPNSLRLEDHDTPVPRRGELLLKVLNVGICGTDKDIIAGFYGEAPADSSNLVLGHESLCRVVGEGGNLFGFKKGDLVVPTVRRNCPENCMNCRRGMSDMCLTGHYLEHGIKGLHGFAREFALSDHNFVVKLPESLSDLGILLEPLTIVEKGVTQAYLMQESRMAWKPRIALVLGAGPVGLLATAILRLRGLEVHTVATRSEESLKARLVEQTGAKYISSNETPLSTLENRYDMVLEITGNTSVALEAQNLTSVNGIVSYLGIYRQEQATEDAGKVFTNLVLGNRVSFGSVNANKSYFLRGVKDLSRINNTWPGFLKKIITRREKPANFKEAYAPVGEEGIKTVIQFKV
jgi:threonine dehydrogenase-like Zn-dependent dehydrogenase